MVGKSGTALLCVALLAVAFGLSRPSSILKCRSKVNQCPDIAVPVRSWEMKLGDVSSVLAGAAAGAIGVVVAYPFDSLKTKTQAKAMAAGGSESVELNELGMLDLAKRIFNEGGLKGFYQGVAGAMLGQAAIKSCAFATNDFALRVFFLSTRGSATLSQTILSAVFSGLCTSIITTPIERVKILMQADSEGKYPNEWACLLDILSSDGQVGLFTRGIDAMVLRETPSYAIYFSVYSLLLHLPLTEQYLPGASAPLVCGALAGMTSWVPVYPIDVCKTYMQNSSGTKKMMQGGHSRGRVRVDGEGDKEGDEYIDMNFGETFNYLKETFGPGVFWDGLTPKLIRAAVNHSVTFTVYDLIIELI